MGIVAFDLETTGLDGNVARIVEFCLIELDDSLNELSRWTELVHPGIPIPAETVKVHGITDEMVRDRPRFEAFASRVQALVQGAVLVAHNAKFDLEILSRELARAGQPGLKPNHPCIDTQRIEAFVNSHSLAETYKRYNDGKPFEGGHRSEADTAATVEVLRRQRLQHAQRLPAHLEGLVTAELERLRDPDRPVREFLDHGRWIFADAKGVFHYNRGKYRGRAVFEDRETRDYLRWMSDTPGIRASIGNTLDGLLVQAREMDARERATAGQPGAPGAQPARTEGHGKFHRATSGHFAFSFGKYRGCPAVAMHECTIDLRQSSHTDYVRWMLEKADFEPAVKAFAASLLGVPFVPGAAPLPPASATPRAPSESTLPALVGTTPNSPVAPPVASKPAAALETP